MPIWNEKACVRTSPQKRCGASFLAEPLGDLPALAGRHPERTVHPDDLAVDVVVRDELGHQ